MCLDFAQFWRSSLKVKQPQCCSRIQVILTIFISLPSDGCECKVVKVVVVHRKRGLLQKCLSWLKSWEGSRRNPRKMELTASTRRVLFDLCVMRSRGGDFWSVLDFYWKDCEH